MKYETGEEVRVGDSVLLEHGKTLGKVKSIVQTIKQMEEWNVNEVGLLIESVPFGLVFWPATYPEDPVQYLDRQSQQ